MQNDSQRLLKCKKICSICGKTINIELQESCYYTDDDKPICEECWNEGKDMI